VIRSLVFASALLLAVPLPLAAQSDKTCIAYMEADATYEVAEKEAAAACDKAVAPYYDACRVARDSSQDACDNATHALNIAAGRVPIPCKMGEEHPECESTSAALQAAEALRKDACQEIWVACDQEAREEACRSAKQAILNAAEETWGRAYSTAYQGPTSNIQSVFQKLVLADRERCWERFGQ